MRVRAHCIAAAALSAAQFAASAVAGSPPDTPAHPQVELWTGGEAFKRVWSLYAGGTYAPFTSVQSDGFRLRAVAGYGGYSYTSPRWTGSGIESLKFRGAVTFADLLAGYHKQFGSLTIKVLAGLTIADHSVNDPESGFGGTHWGGRAVLETWWNISDQSWTSLDLSWTTLDDVYGARMRLGWRLWPAFSAGLEGGATGNGDYETARLGGFLRYEWATGEASISAGIAGDGPSSGQVRLDGPFATINVLTRF